MIAPQGSKRSADTPATWPTVDAFADPATNPIVVASAVGLNTSLANNAITADGNTKVAGSSSDDVSTSARAALLARVFASINQPAMIASIGTALSGTENSVRKVVPEVPPPMAAWRCQVSSCQSVIWIAPPPATRVGATIGTTETPPVFRAASTASASAAGVLVGDAGDDEGGAPTVVVAPATVVAVGVGVVPAVVFALEEVVVYSDAVAAGAADAAMMCSIHHLGALSVMFEMFE